jgi:PHP family Zn ribbon phosphoesterase
MNWCIPELDSRAILSFSDAHSLPKLGREATVFEIPDGQVSYDAIYAAVSNTHPAFRKQNAGGVEANTFRIAYTIEFYPEEGKYHYTGHRACNVRLTPEETRAQGTTCSVCGKPLTEGVMQRVETLSAYHAAGKPVRTEGTIGLYKKPIEGLCVQGTYSSLFPDRPPFVMLVPLREIISECIGSPVASPKVSVKYDALLDAFGTEFAVLLKISKEEIEKIAGLRIAEGIEKVRTGDIVIDPGYDGVFGVVKLWKDAEEKPLVDATKVQLGLL